MTNDSSGCIQWIYYLHGSWATSTISSSFKGVLSIPTYNCEELNILANYWQEWKPFRVGTIVSTLLFILYTWILVTFMLLGNWVWRIFRTNELGKFPFLSYNMKRFHSYRWPFFSNILPNLTSAPAAIVERDCRSLYVCIGLWTQLMENYRQILDFEYFCQNYCLLWW